MNQACVAGIVGCICLIGAAGGSQAKGREFDIAPFSLPNCADGEVRFEEPRDVSRVVVTFEEKAPSKVDLSYAHKIWPDSRTERDYHQVDNAMAMGWYPIEDWFNCDWRKAEANLKRLDDHRVEITFKGLTREFPAATDYDVTFRRTQGIRIATDPAAKVRKVEVYTTSHPTKSSLRVLLDAGAKTKAERVTVTGYNATVDKLKSASGTVKKNAIDLKAGGTRSFVVDITHMIPAHKFCNDDGLVTFDTGTEVFTVSMDSLQTEGPIWYADEGVFITLADDTTTLDQYKARFAGKKNIDRMLAEMPEQSLGGAMNGQPRPHADSFVLGCKNARQRFRIEANGDVHMAKTSMDWVALTDTPNYKNDGDCRFFFGLEKWRVAGRYPDPEPIMAYNTHLLSDDISVEQKSFAVPLVKKVSDRLVGDDRIIAVLRFTFRNTSDHPATAEMPIGYSSQSGQSLDRLAAGSQSYAGMDGNRVPTSKRDTLSVEISPADPSMKVLTSVWKDEKVVRCAVDTSMEASQSGSDVVLRKELQPGECCTVTLKIPYVSLDADEQKALAKLDPDASYREVCEYWRGVGKMGAQIHSPEPRLDALYRSHFAHVSIADFAMPNDPDLINTSVGSSIYPNFTNESCMIVQELEERGLHDEARRRLAVWVKYQGTMGLRGNFSDHDGLYYGAGGFECGETYDQHHGWALWRISEHYLLTRDDAWMRSVSDSIIKGCDWVFRQRRHTMEKLPHSRGWEYGFLPAGSLEDVSDYFYWLSTNSVTWRGVDSAARALEAIGHPEAARIRKEADAYRQDLINGFEKSRQNSPLVRLRDGRWVPHYPSRLYLRGRDVGWIREILEGAVYLLISGLYDPNSKQATWILDDYQDNRYMSPDYGYPIFNREGLWFDVGGFSCQPNLLAGLMPYLDRDEPEVYIWMFFNAWAACYREEANSMVEHPCPILGHSNIAIVKTSDQSNAMKWLTYMYVYAPGDTLYLGRAIPREWLSDGKEVSAEKISTRFGEVSVRYRSDVAQGRIILAADLSLTQRPGRIIARIRHPEKKPIKSVTINGAPYTQFDAAKGDIDLTGMTGKVSVSAEYR